MAPDHPLAGRAGVRFADVLPYPLVMAEHGMSLRDAVDLIVPANIDFTPAVETNSLELMRLLARTSPHVTCLSLVEVDLDVATGALAFVPFTGPHARQSVALVHRAAGPLDAVASVFAQHVGTAFERRTRALAKA